MRNLLALLLFVPTLCLAQLPDYVPTEDLYGWYNLDGDAQDASGNGHHGQPQLIQPCSGVTNTSGGVEFTQQNSLIEWASDDLLSLEPQEAMTISIWFKSDFSQSPSHLFGKRSGCSGTSGINYQLAWQNDGIAQHLLVGMSLNLCDGFNEGYDVGSGWTHVVTTYDDGWGEMWVNGEIFMACSSLLGATNSSPFLLGGSGTCTGFYGCMDQLGIWNRALTAEEISQLYSASSPTLGCTDPTACNFDPLANSDDGSCEYGCLYCGEGTVWDSTLAQCISIADTVFIEPEACAPSCGEGTVWDSTLAQCISIADTVFIEPEACAPSCGEGTVWDPVNEECIIAIPADLNYDGCVSVNDLLILLAVHGTCPPYPEWPDEPTDTTWTCGDPLTYWDYDYATVLIGDQCWFSENLRTTVYGNGDVIPAGLSDGEWTSTTAGATAVYGEGSSGCGNYSPEIDACDEAQSLAAYGRLYNWYAVNDARGLCSAGWHVPTDGEWTELEDYITSQGFSGTEGSALKSTSGWSSGGNGTDDFGFSALPAGSRSGANGIFNSAGLTGSWWTSSLNGGVGRRFLRHIDSLIFPNITLPDYAFSVRCIKD